MSQEDQIAALESRLRREKTARQAAEALLEQKSAELFDHRQSLEATILERTEALSEKLEEVNQLRSALEQERDAAINESAAKTLMFAKLSHEIRTPLNGVVGAINFLDDLVQSDAVAHWISVARGSVSTLKTILNDTIDLARLEAGVITLEESHFSLADLLADIEDFWRPQVRDNQRIELHVDPALPAYVIGDAGRLRQILDNYLSNAVKYGGAGSILLAADQLHRDGDQALLRLSVSDRGETLPQDQCNSLFEPFDRGIHSLAPKQGHDQEQNRRQPENRRQTGRHTIGRGVGLGLLICRELADLMDGALGVEPAAPNGNRFFLTMTLKAGKAEAPEGRTTRRDSRDIDGKLDGLSVLVVEDVPTNQMVLERYLRHFGCLVETAENGLEAVEMVKARAERPYDMILMDIAMPEMDGFEATRHIKAMQGCLSTIPIIGVSAHVGEGETHAMLQAGMVDHVPKPIDPRLLRRAMAAQIDAVNPSSDSANPDALNKAALPPPSQSPHQQSYDHPASDHPASDHPASDHPASGHPASGQQSSWMDSSLADQLAKDIAVVVRDISDARTAKNIHALTDALHKMKSLSGTFGLALADEIEAVYADAKAAQIQFNDSRLDQIITTYTNHGKS